MPTPVFLTVDTEIAWRHHRAGLDAASVYGRSIEPAGVGVSYHLARLREYGLKATFFVASSPFTHSVARPRRPTHAPATVTSASTTSDPPIQRSRRRGARADGR